VDERMSGVETAGGSSLI